jgi:hypothetical protein
MMKTKDKGRKWMWMFLAALVSLQMYFVWELLAVFALFAIGFAAIASVVGSLYMLHRVWAVAVERIADSRHPVMVATRQGITRSRMRRAGRFGVRVRRQPAN